MLLLLGLLIFGLSRRGKKKGADLTPVTVGAYGATSPVRDRDAAPAAFALRRGPGWAARDSDASLQRTAGLPAAAFRTAASPEPAGTPAASPEPAGTPAASVRRVPAAPAVSAVFLIAHERAGFGT